MIDTDQPQFLTVRELAVVLRISEATARILVRSGEIPSARVGGRWRVSIDALERHLGARVKPPQP